MDVIIPLGPGSTNGNAELRYLLRSIDRNCSDVGRVFLVTDCCPDWIDTEAVTVVHVSDTHERNKDANLIDKTLTVVRDYNLDAFCWCADDNVFIGKCSLEKLPIVFNNRGRDMFEGKGNRWHQRMRNTFDVCAQLGVHYKYNYESHSPQVFRNAQLIAMRAPAVGYEQLPGCTIMTLFRALEGVTTGTEQTLVKETAASPEDVAKLKFDKLFLGYDDGGFTKRLQHRLNTMFPAKCRYEKR